MLMGFERIRSNSETRAATPACGGEHDPATAIRLQHEVAALLPSLRRYAGALKRNPVEADDLVQASLCRALAKLHLWRQGTDLRAWAYAILHNEHVSECRRSIRRARREAAEAASVQLQHDAPDALTMLRLRDLDRAIRNLPEPQRRAILLVGLENIAYDAAATILDIPIGTLRSRLARARQTLRIAMEMDSAPVIHTCPDPADPG